jgi:transposase InsO family protein
MYGDLPYLSSPIAELQLFFDGRSGQKRINELWLFSIQIYVVSATAWNQCSVSTADALRGHGKPEIFNSDQGSQFTSEAFTGVLKR